MLRNQYMPEVRTPGPFALISFTRFDECAAAKFLRVFSTAIHQLSNDFQSKAAKLGGNTCSEVIKEAEQIFLHRNQRETRAILCGVTCPSRLQYTLDN